jgi:autotransporter-associated beta strand protein
MARIRNSCCDFGCITWRHNGLESEQTLEANLLFGRWFVADIRVRCGVYFLALAGAALLPTVAQAQSVWGGTGSSTTTANYNLGTNWSSAPAGAPPIAGGQSAQFANTGNAGVVVAGPITPDSWTFNANSQSYSVSGAAVNFGTTTGLVNNATAGSISIANNLGGAGAQLQQLGTNTLTLTGTNTYTGATTISAGTLALTGTGSIAASGLVNLTNAGATFDISGTTSGASIAVLNGVSGSNVNLGAQTLTITAGDTLHIYYGTIGGNGGLTVTGGFAELGGTNTYTGVTTINSGADLVLLGTGTVASSSKVIDNGALDLSVMSVNSSITSLAGTNTGALLFLGNHSLTLTAANDTFAGVISNSGGLALTSGTEVLTGINTYTGATTINGGRLIVDGSIATSSLTTVNSGGTLTGLGTVGNTTIASGGMFAPGTVTLGLSMTVSGNLAFQSGAQYLIALNPATSSFANVTGTATLGGATVQATYASSVSYVTKQYTILSAGGVSGTFGSLVNTNLPSNFVPTLAYDATHAYLDLTLSFAPAPTSGAPNYSGLNGNQQAVGNALINSFNLTGGIPLVFGTLTATGLTQISGETAIGSQQTTFDAMTQFMGVMTDPFIGDHGGAAASSPGATGFADEGNGTTTKRSDAYAMFAKAPPAAFEPRWSAWTAGFGGSQTSDGNAAVGSNSTTSRIYGTAVGADYLFSPFTLAGFALAGGGTNFSVANGGSGRSDLFQAGAYMRHTVGPAYVSAALAYGWQDITTDRIVTAAGLDHLHAEFNANAVSGRVEGGYRLVAPWVGGLGGGLGVTPYAAAQFTTFDLPAYAESAVSGASTFAIAYAPKSVTDTRSELGIRTDQSFAMQDSMLTLRTRLAWAHDFNPDRSIAATFQALPGASFTVNGAAQAADAALTTASIERKWLSGFSLAATFEGEFSDVTRSYAGKGVVRYQW